MPLFFIIQILAVSLPQTYTSNILETENAVLTKSGEHCIGSFTLHMKARQMILKTMSKDEGTQRSVQQVKKERRDKPLRNTIKAQQKRRLKRRGLKGEKVGQEANRESFSRIEWSPRLTTTDKSS